MIWKGAFSPSVICSTTYLTIPTAATFKYSTTDDPSGKNIYYQIPVNFDNALVTLPAFETGTNLQLSLSKKFSVQVSSLGNLTPRDKVGTQFNFGISATFDIKDELDKVITTTTVDLTGSTCFPLNQKDYSSICVATKESEGLIKLLNAMAGNGDIKPSGITGSAPILLNDNVGTAPRNIYNNDFSPYLKSYFNRLVNSTADNPWYVSTNVPGNANSKSNTATINVSRTASSSAAGVRLFISLFPEKASTLPANFDIGNVRAITCFRNLGVDNMLGVTAMYFDPEKPGVAGSYDFKISVAPVQEGQPNAAIFPLVKCGPPKPEECKSVAHENTQSLQNFLNDLINRRPVTEEVTPGKFVMTGNTKLTAGQEGISADISTSFSNHLKNQLTPEKQYYFQNVSISQLNDRRQLSANLSCQTPSFSNFRVAPTGGEPTITPLDLASQCENCQIKLEYLEEIPKIEFANFVGFEGLSADYSNSRGGITYDFYVTGIYYNPKGIGAQPPGFYTTTLRGTSCFPVANCKSVCTQGKKELLTNGNFNNPFTKLSPPYPTAPDKIIYEGEGYKSDYILKIIPECNTTDGICLNQNEGVVSRNARLVHKNFERSDHTGNDGYLFVFNGAEGKRAWFTNMVVTKNKSYRFSASLSNVCVGCKNVSRFKLYYKPKDSKTITEFIDTDPITYTQNWVKASYQFDSKFDGEIEVGIIAMAPLGNTDGIIDDGYDFALDDVSFTESCNERLEIFPDYPEQASNPCDQELSNLANLSKMHRLKMLAPNANAIRTSYVNSCLKAKENLNYKYNSQEHHYTLYYYDQAGNLLKTVPPEGVHILDQTRDADKLAAITKDRLQNTYTLGAQPRHTMASTYKYNSLNQLVQQSVPDNDQINLLENTSAAGINYEYTPTNVQLGEGNEGFLVAQDATGISHLYHTANAGSSWGEVSGVGIENINKVKFVDPQLPTAYAVGDKGTVLVTNNAGLKWTAEQIGSSGDLIDLHIFAPGNVIIFERNGLIWRSAGGGSWISYTSLSTMMKGELQQIAVSGNSVYVISKDADRGYLYLGTNQGTLWSDISATISTGSLSKISFFDKNNGIAYAGQSMLLNTKDGGTTWKIIPTNLPSDAAFDLIMTGVSDACILASGTDGNNLYRAKGSLNNWKPIKNVGGRYNKFSKSSDGTLFATGLTYKSISSLDGGDTWKFYTDIAEQDDEYEIIGSSSPDANNLFSVSRYNQIIKSTRSPAKSVQIPSPSTANVINIHFSSVSNACALVDDGMNKGKIYYTTTANQPVPVWTASATSIAGLMSNFIFYNANDGFGYLETAGELRIYKTANAGVTWNTVYDGLPINGYLKDFKFFDAQKGYIITSTGNVYTSTDGGAAWKQEDKLPTFPPALTAIAISGGKAVIGGDNGFVMNNSAGWVAQRSGLNTRINALAFASATRVVAAAVGRAVYSDDAGINWRTSLGMVGAVKNIMFSSGIRGTAVGNGGLIVTTVDGGVNWQPTVSTTKTNLNDISANKDKNIIVGDAGIILTGIGPYIPSQGVAPMNISGSSLVKGSSVGYVVGDKGTVAKTTDLGKTWKLLSFPSAKNLHGVYFISDQVGVVAGESGAIYKTTDGGLNWKAATVPSTVFGKTMYCVALSGNNGYIAADGMLLGSTDGGSTWIVKKIITGKAYSIAATDDKTAYAVGSAGMMYKTADAGANWSEMQKKEIGKPAVNWTTNDLKSVRFTTYLTGYAVGKSGTLLKTINEGASWKQVGDRRLAGDMEDISFSNTNHAAIAGSGEDGGLPTTLDDYTDEISSRFWYDELGRMIISQNAKQFKAQNYSYTDYDALGRIREVGEINKGFNALPTFNSIGQITLPAFTAWLSPTTSERKQVTRTYYDRVHRVAFLASDFIKQKNLRTRVASIVYNETVNNTYDKVGAGAYQHATHYSYDIHGNVKSILQDNPSMPFSQETDKQRYKKIDYSYDLISGNVNEVKYQPGQADQFLHRYYYDADNRITSVETSTDGVSWSRDAKYFYYKHGPLKRTELGEYKVQGTDYVYTLQGWIKGVNSNTLMAQRDPGKDGDATANGVNRYVAADAHSYSLGYYNGDYKPIQPKATTDYFLASTAGYTGLNAVAPDLYNGNISQMVTSIKGVITDIGIPKPQLTLYQYDQLNRIKEMKAYSKINMETNAWGSGTDIDGAHQTIMEYDANGNITRMKRNGMSGNLVMDDMDYLYENVLSGSVKNTNKLIQVLDKASKSAYATDIDGQEAKNYTYDEIGNLIRDDAEKISNIEWSVYGKPLKITKNIGGYGPTTEIEFRYDAIGNRVAKIVKPMYNIDNPEAWNHTFYVRDASGNVMATYQRTGYTKLMLEEQSIYGSSRLGVQRRNLDFMAATTNPSYKYYLNQKYYELSDHRGNVNTTISDFRIGVGSPGNPKALSHYTAVIRSTADYGVWGDELVGRGERGKDFRYGFNGKEKDGEVKGEANSYDYGFRFYDPRIGRFLSLDPLAHILPGWSPYKFALSNPIRYMDGDGRFEVDAVTAKKYPKFTAYINNLLSEYADKPTEFKAAFKKFSNLSDDQIKTLLSKGQGPRLTVRNLDTPEKEVNGSTVIGAYAATGKEFNVDPDKYLSKKTTEPGKGLILIDEDLAKAFEEANNVEDYKGAMLLVESTVLHEGTHYGNAKKGSDPFEKKNLESGKEFEKQAYGADIDSENANEIASPETNSIEPKGLKLLK